MDLPKDIVTYVPLLPSCHEIDFSLNEPYVCLCRQYFPDLYPAAIYQSISFGQTKNYMQILLNTIICMLQYWEKFKDDFDVHKDTTIPGLKKMHWIPVVDTVQLLTKHLEECLQCENDVEKYTREIAGIRKNSNFHKNLAQLSHFSLPKSPTSNYQLFCYKIVISEVTSYKRTVEYEHLSELEKTRFCDQIALIEEFQLTWKHYYSKIKEMSLGSKFNTRQIVGAKLAEMINRLFKSGPFPDAFIDSLVGKQWCRITELDLILPAQMFFTKLSAGYIVNSVFCILFGMTRKEHVLSHCLFMVDPILQLNAL